jgi:hypothetical protein
MNLEAPKEAPKLDPGQQAVNIIIEAGKAGNLTLLNAIKEAFPTIESKSEKNMENIRKFAIENNISPNVILALLYTEKSTTDKTSKAIETNITPPTTVIESQTP